MCQTLLLVEDSIVNQKVAVAQLKKLGFAIDIAENGQIAVELATTNQYCLVLMDCQMPVMDGLEATQKLRSHGFKEPIIAMTANTMDIDRQRCLDAGMDDYISKPISTEQLKGLLAKYTQMLKPKQAVSETEGKSAYFFNKARLDGFFGDDMESRQEFLTIYIDSTMQLIEDINLAIKNADFETLGGLGHNLKGSSSNVGIGRLAELGLAIETTSKEKDVDKLAKIAQEIQTVFELIKEEIMGL